MPHLLPAKLRGELQPKFLYREKPRDYLPVWKCRSKIQREPISHAHEGLLSCIYYGRDVWIHGDEHVSNC
ncbi:hypothetical protein C5167_009825 [Papaver somniferum]|uniref:Uncharacterized protein n=1 Tax=Papaver somniferum TaxID=3469 RepID=A0A4Y7JYG0_PAPSO|nr:hypothetical protein C5167_009825 [Papaver somniferum]